jgi:hypothetical protein
MVFRDRKSRVETISQRVQQKRKEFDDIFDIPRLYINACSNSVQLIALHPIMISVVFHHYKQLMQLRVQVDQMKGGVRTELVQEAS